MFSTVDNRVQLIGYLGTEIDIREYPRADTAQPIGKIARMALATNEFRRDANGNKETITTWHNLVAHGSLAKLMAGALSKGQRIYVEGKLSYRQTTRADNSVSHSTEIIISDFKKLERDDKA